MLIGDFYVLLVAPLDLFLLENGWFDVVSV